MRLNEQQVGRCRCGKLCEKYLKRSMCENGLFFKEKKRIFAPFLRVNVCPHVKGVG